MKSNFSFLKSHFPVLENFGELAEKYLYNDSNSCLMKLGMIGETIVNLCFTYDKISLPRDNTAVNRIDNLFDEGMIPHDLADILHALRKTRNKAVHENYESVEDGKALIQMAYSLCEWFMQTYGDWNYQNQPFVMPSDTFELVSANKQNEQAYEEELIEEAENTAIAAPTIEREIRNYLTEQAEDSAIQVFGKNLTQLLMQPPIVGQVVLGWDPAFRTGCKLAIVDATGKVLDTTVIYPTAPQNKVEDAKKVLKEWIQKYHVTLISLGNGTASRESEMVIVELLKEINQPISYVIVNEAGASVYSASKLATEEFPNFDVGQRSAASIARRLQDPLAELVKIDPKSIGVGQYQHDMDQKKLGEALNAVVEDCVNKVGVDLNTASASLLEYISGISKAVAKNIVTYREENGKFETRSQLLKVPKLGPKAYEQCAGFMRIQGGKNPLDATSVHPESYEKAMALLEKLGYSLKDFTLTGLAGISKKIKEKNGLSQELGIGEITLQDIGRELEKPARDPREEMPKPILRTDVLEMKDLETGMILKGTVRNVIDFGAFVDIGVKHDGLVHISEMSNSYIKNPSDIVSVGDIVKVKVIKIDKERQKVGLSMKLN